MIKIPLTAVPNQTVAFTADGAYWQLHFFQAIDKMYCDIERNGTVIMSSTRCLTGIGLMPYRDLHLPLYGNFIFDYDVDWTEFGSNCNLYYLTVAELADYQAMVDASYDN